MEGIMIMAMIFGLLAYWITAGVLFILGLINLLSRDNETKRSKGNTQMIIAVIMLIIGGSVCGGMMF